MGSLARLIDEFGARRTDEVMAQVVAAGTANEFDAADVWRLSDAMARSGTVAAFGDGCPTADLASTGGPSSLSTLLGPLYLRSYEFIVPKLGVPGRPAGGIDVLAQLPGYKIRLTLSEINDAIERCGYAHFLADENFAPLDANFFRYRQMAGAQDVPALAAASLLAKKIACGVRFAGLDVRVATHGNFGKTFHEASRTASMFCAAARMAGIEAVAVLTNAHIPYQPFIGRGEALMALNSIFSRSVDVWLDEHDDVCRLMAAHVGLLDGKSRLGHGTGDIAQAFARNIEAQGSSMDAFRSKVEAVTEASRREVVAEHEGFLRLDLASIRSAFGKAHGRLVSEHEFPDAFGVILRKRPGAYVRQGDGLASVRLGDVLWPEISEFVSRAFQVAEAPDYAPGIEEIVRA